MDNNDNNDKTGKSDNAFKTIAVSVIIALVAGSSAPWWWDRLFAKPLERQSPTPVVTPTPSQVNQKPAAGKVSPVETPQPAPAPLVAEDKDTMQVVAISPPTNTVLPNNSPFAITMRLRYRLVSADSWLLVPYLEQFTEGDKCGSPNHRTIGTTKPDRVQIKRGAGEVSIQFTVQANEHSELGARGYVAPNASAWAGFDSQGKVIVIEEGLWSFSDHCYRLGS